MGNSGNAATEICMRLIAWALMYADDIALMPENEEQMQAALELVDCTFSQWGLELSIKKTKIMQAEHAGQPISFGIGIPLLANLCNVKQRLRLLKLEADVKVCKDRSAVTFNTALETVLLQTLAKHPEGLTDSFRCWGQTRLPGQPPCCFVSTLMPWKPC